MSKEENDIYESFEIEQNLNQNKQKYSYFIQNKKNRIKLIIKKYQILFY